MKFILSAAFLFTMISAGAQSMLIPAGNAAERKWIKNQSYQMAWYAVKDSTRIEIGKTTTRVIVSDTTVTVITSISMQQTNSPWIDSTIAGAKDLSPLYHSSYNAQRNMVLHFGQVVKGFYTDKIRNSHTAISDTTNVKYFDSNLYPSLITWLPLKEGYKKTIAIYDYSPGGKPGVVKACIHDVTKGKYQTGSSGTRSVWIVAVSDEIAGAANGLSTYFIDTEDRRLWKQEINAGGRTREMILIEQ